MPSKSDTVDYHYKRARQLALIEVEKKARSILKKHSDLKEFIMGMGVYYFTNDLGNSISDFDPRSNRLDIFIEQWDSYLKLTGNPMRFTAFGKKITDW